MSVTQEILELRFNNWSDQTSRHTMFVANATLSDQSVAEYKSAYFNGSSYLQLIDNDQDWVLGSTVNKNPVSNTWTPTNSDSEFTIDTWIYPLESYNYRYYPICSSFKSVWYNKYEYNLGWSLQLDVASRKLQLVSYVFGDCYRRVIESNFTIPLNQWTHIVLMSWKQLNNSAKLFYINGNPDGGDFSFKSQKRPNITNSLFTDSFPISNVVGGQALGLSDSLEYSPFYIGLAPRSLLTDSNLVNSFFFSSKYGLGFYGYISRFRVCLGTRYPTGSTVFNPLIDPSATTTTTSSITTTLTTTTTTTSIQEWGEIPISIDSNDLLALKLRNNIEDLTNRHYIRSIGNPNFVSSDLGCKSLYFNGTCYLEVVLNQNDFSLGSTLIPNTFVESDPLCYFNNKFSLEFWIKPHFSGQRYLGICGSFSENFFPTDTENTFIYGEVVGRRDYSLGWSIQLDTLTGYLQFISYAFGSISTIFQSTLSVPLDEWTHVAIMSVPKDQYSYKYLFINGVPDSINPYKNPSLGWTNGVHRDPVNSPINSYSGLFLGLGALSNLESDLPQVSLDYRLGSYFCGNISTFRLSTSNKYPTDGSTFTPFRIPMTSTSTGSTTVTSTTLTTLTSTTLPPDGYVKVGGSLYASSSQTDNLPIKAGDDNLETAWEPISSPQSWVGIECDDSND